MSTTHQQAIGFGARRRPNGLRTGIAVIGLGLLAQGCSQEGDPLANPQSSTEATRPSADAVPAAAPLDASLSEQIDIKRRTLIADAVTALAQSQSALDLLAIGKTDDAVEALARATGKLDVVLAADPDLALAPVGVRVETHDVLATPEDVKALRDLAEAALDDGRLQNARHLVADLASEHVISTVNIPLASYPGAIKRAAALVHSGNVPGAMATLETALATLVVQDTVVALPLARAEAMMRLAQPLAELAQRSAEDSARLRRFLADARLQIELAQALGYATKDDLDALSNELEVIEEKTQGDSNGTGLFDRIKALFSEANREANSPRQP